MHIVNRAASLTFRISVPEECALAAALIGLETASARALFRHTSEIPPKSTVYPLSIEN